MVFFCKPRIYTLDLLILEMKHELNLSSFEFKFFNLLLEGVGFSKGEGVNE